jgi:hypothetical protein
MKFMGCSIIVAKDIAQIRSTIVLRNLIADRGESGQDSGHAKITCLLGSIARGMGQCEVTGIVFTPNLQRLDVVNIDCLSVELKINGLFAYEAVPMLRLMEMTL